MVAGIAVGNSGTGAENGAMQQGAGIAPPNGAPGVAAISVGVVIRYGMAVAGGISGDALGR